MMTFGEMIFWHASRQPHKLAVIGPGSVITYGGLRDAIGFCALRIQALGWKPGGTVAILVDNRLGHLIVAAALSRLGFTTMSSRSWRDVQESGVELAGVLTTETVPPGTRIPFVKIDNGWVSPGPDKRVPPATPKAPEEIHHIALTSGSTGIPKPIGFDGQAIREVQLDVSTFAGGIAWDRLLCIPGPQSYFGYAFCTMAFLFGKTLVYAETYVECLQLASLFGVDWIVASNVQLEGMIKQQAADPVALPRLQMVYFGGSLVTQALLQAAHTQFPAQIVCGYGTTESGIIAACPAERLPRTEGATGFVAPWVSLEAVGPDGSTLPRGQEGVLRIWTPAQGRAFDPASGRFEEAGPERAWAYPGDRGRVEADGMLVITGREDHLINAGGMKIAPELLEQILLAYPDIAETAVVSIPDRLGIEEIWVAVVPRGPVADEEAFRQECLDRIRKVRQLTLRGLVFLASIPKTDLGKPMRKAVRDALMAAAGRAQPPVS